MMNVSMKKKQKSILFLSPYPINKAPSQRLKYEQYFSYFEEAGFNVQSSSFIDNDLWTFIYKKGYFIKKSIGILNGYWHRIKDLFQIRKHDIVYVHLWVTPIGPPIFEWMVSKLAKKLLYDIDDMIYFGHSSKANASFSFLKGKSKAIFMMKKADHIICGSTQLQKFAAVYCYHTTVVSTTIDTLRYKPKEDYSLHDPIIIGWSGSHSTSKYLLLLQDVLKNISKKYSFILKVIGDADFTMDQVKVQSMEWKLDNEIENLRTFDIGLCPLPNDKWVYGKSGGKTLLYMSMGIPTLASDYGPNSDIIENGINGFLLKKDEEWIYHLEKLIEDSTLREIIGRNGCLRVEKKYSIKANKDKYIQIFNTLIDQ